MEKERVYITHINLHVRDFRQTLSFTKVAQRGLIYSPASFAPTSTPEVKKGSPKEGRLRISMNLPTDLRDRINRGEVELMVPSDGIPVYAGADTLEFMKMMEEKKRRHMIHTGQVFRRE